MSHPRFLHPRFPESIIFDWSGTIVDDLPPVIEATNAVLAYAGRPALTREQFRRQFKLPYIEFYEEAAPHVPIDELEVVFRQAFSASREPVTLLPEAAQFLAFVADLGARMFVLSSAPASAVEQQAKDLGIHHHFERFHAGIPNKVAHIPRLLEQHSLHPGSAIMIGDMIHDVETARSAGLFSVAVLTGYDYPEVLESAVPDLTVAHLGELRSWLEESAAA